MYSSAYKLFFKSLNWFLYSSALVIKLFNNSRIIAVKLKTSLLLNVSLFIHPTHVYTVTEAVCLVATCGSPSVASIASP